MFFTFLCYFTTLHIFPYDKIVKITDFGFEYNGSYTFRYISQNYSGFIIFMLSREYSSFAKSSYLSFLRICNRSFPEEPYMAYYLEGRDLEIIEGRVNKTTVLVPFVANCHSHQLNLNIQMKNMHSYLDYRDYHIPSIYLMMSFIYPFISVFWVINGLFYPQFHVTLHTMLSFSGVFKALSLYYSAKVWNTKALFDKCPLTLQLVSELTFVFSHSFLFIINALAISGWGTYREKIPFDQIINTSLITMWFFIVISICHCATYAFFFVPLYAMAVFVCCIYGQMIYSDIISAIHLIPLVRRTNYNEMMYKKIELIVRFGGIVTVWMTILTFFLIYFLVGDVPHYVQNTIYELFILAIYIIDIYVFFFRKSYEPVCENVEEVEEPEPEKQELVLLKEPNDEWFSMFNTHKFLSV
ncbi:hypothetical protein TRFO_06937 [Tritrichomonas foetus]|uniref:Intimal thickness related receptor IRP domain-containing protein n=1 Tax=Tritrichomonas foetus TaxID=1144522 RepID=A0A1J4JZC9_9EUKA|nr:hypothetical protein TRFO_06937 [Tritrichomonas foetus]|eukprot:OHT02884.1 hypothetical protein TRFO_06937 [Tritrichomonas foetus]